MTNGRPVPYPGPTPNPGPWHIQRTFQALEKKLRTIEGSDLKVAVIDLWIGWLFELRAGIELKEYYREHRREETVSKRR